jgi:hypothetical protein
MSKYREDPSYGCSFTCDLDLFYDGFFSILLLQIPFITIRLILITDNFSSTST